MAAPLSLCVAVPVDPAAPGMGRRWQAMADAEALARTFADAGHKVTLAHWPGAMSSLSGDDGIRLVEISAPQAPRRDFQPHMSSPGSALIRAETFHRWLKEQSFDAVYAVGAPECAAVAAMDRAMGLGGITMPVVAVLDAPVADPVLLQDATLAHPELLLSDALERDVVRLADAVVVPDPAVADRLTGIVPEAPQPAVLPVPMAGRRTTTAQAAPIGEIVFFGRLDAASGVWLFCDVIETLIARGALSGVKVTAIGPLERGGDGLSARSLGYRTARWGIDFDHVPAESYDGAIAVLAERRDNALVVAPFLAAPDRRLIADLLAGSFSFVTTDIDGVADMLAPESRSAAVAPKMTALADTISAALADGFAAPMPALPRDGIAAAWSAHATTLAGRTASPAPLNHDLSVIILHRDRPDYLRQALESLDAQTRLPDEVVLVDNASETEAACKLLADLETEFADKDWKIVRLDEHLSPMLARNAGFDASTGEAIVFLDDDNALTPDALRAYAKAVDSGRFDAVASPLDCFEGDAPPSDAAGIHRRQLFAGSAGALSLFSNAMGDTNMVVTRKAFEAVGRFPDPGYSYVSEDWYLMALLSAHGQRIGVLPEAVVLFRESAGAVKKNWKKANHEGARHQVFRLLAGIDPRDTQLALLYAQGLFHRGGVDPSQGTEPPPAPVRKTGFWARLRRLLGL
ncbi:GT2 family glycosyltransferase [Rhodobium orientis]|uniref:Glycosyltransferase 2-like domain-containing protein n=1 Tax=Rhodobium orientis TaxID=34017 RepID=A0A327JTC4_9HYPH|nr:glycosyltransferase [Rhodobium orientis]MBB4304245.1 GT2 family glycosyltransferase [Rhodobium orientis]MBK5948258.1 hypothetical protein [Rhodobium orientis]RAI28756.1 hypothetical protein CH339_04955 [Rhodobium orientis]